MGAPYKLGGMATTGSWSSDAGGRLAFSAGSAHES